MKRWEIDAVGRQHLRLNDVEVPKPGPKEVLIQVNAVALNYRDKMVVETGRGLPLKFPFTRALTLPEKSSISARALPGSGRGRT